MLTALLEYTPTNRFTPIEAMVHAYYDELRLPETKLPSGKPLPPLFNFAAQGMIIIQQSDSLLRCLLILLFIELSIQPDLRHKLVPQHAEAELKSRGIDINKFTPVSIVPVRVVEDE